MLSCTPTQEQIADVIRQVRRFRCYVREQRIFFPEPEPRQAARFLVTEAAEALDALTRQGKTVFNRASDDPERAQLLNELLDTAFMAASILRDAELRPVDILQAIGRAVPWLSTTPEYLIGAYPVTTEDARDICLSRTMAQLITTTADLYRRLESARDIDERGRPTEPAITGEMRQLSLEAIALAYRVAAIDAGKTAADRPRLSTWFNDALDQRLEWRLNRLAAKQNTRLKRAPCVVA
jgi:hypothetical protein